MTTDQNQAPKSAPSKSLGRKSVRLSVKPQELMTDRPALARAWSAQVVTLFPDAFPGLLGESLTGKALKDGLWQLETTDLRQFGVGKHRNVDDTPSGGGAGMVLRADVVANAVGAARRGERGRMPLIYLSPRGVPFTQKIAQDLSEQDGVTLLCGRFEGVDQRVLDHYDILEVSMGDYVLTGGELPAMTLIDACVRLLPGVLGNSESAIEESHSNGMLEHPQYTRPAEWEGHTIPPVLTSGDHKKVAAWRREMSERITQARRPDLGDKISVPDEIEYVTDSASFTSYIRGVLGAPQTGDIGEFTQAYMVLEAAIACLESNAAIKNDVVLPTNPWTAAAYVFWLGTIYE